ncbi:hypothetical protein D3C76_283810 [compost metagenome]
MALIDTSELLIDPDFCDTVGLIRRSFTVSDKGRTVIEEQAAVFVLMSVQGLKAEDFVRNPDLVELNASKAFWYTGTLLPLIAGEYSDVILWNNLRYQVCKVDEDFTNFGNGHMKVFGALEGSNG